MKKFIPKKTAIKHTIHAATWFGIGFVLAGALLSSLVLFYFRYSYSNRVIPGIFVNNIYVGEKTEDQVRDIFEKRNDDIGQNTIIFTAQDSQATVSAKMLKIGYDTDLIIDQAFNLGKTKNIASDVFIILNSYINGTFLSAPFTFDKIALEKNLLPIQKQVHKESQNAEFDLGNNNRVVAFKQSINGQDADISAVEDKIKNLTPKLIASKSPLITQITVPIKITEPKITTEKANKYGIVELIGSGNSTFYHSIPGRIHNVALASSRINGALVAPGEEFSFVKTLGDVSAYTGYKQAYIISGGKTILGDGGGVCQVSTTLFRALLNAGLPITERHPHAYRVGYYEQNSPAGIDAATYVPTVDLKFKNDTDHYILIQAVVDLDNLALTFNLYGKSDGRVSEISTPVISNISPAPPDVYQDDPTLPVGTIKQVDFAAAGAKAVFTRKVTKNGKEILNDTFVSVYRPWQAIYLKGTKT